MSAHLTHEELTDNLLGVSSLTVNAHLLSCPACANELDQMKSSIAAFRGAAHAWSESAMAADHTVSFGRRPPKRSWTTANWMLAAAAMILFAAGLSFYLRDTGNRAIGKQAHTIQIATPVTAIEASQAQIEKDNELLSQVNNEIAEAVPAPMQPLQLSQSVASSTAAK
jgi:anti-sigma factor RsiW